MVKEKVEDIIGLIRSRFRKKKKIIEKDSAQEALDTIKKINDRLSKFYEK